MTFIFHASAIWSLVGTACLWSNGICWDSSKLLKARILRRVFHSNVCNWCWFLAGTLVGNGTEAFPYGCLALLQHGDWVLWMSIQAGGVRRKLCHLLWPSLHSLQLYFCHILFIRNESRRLAHIQREGTNSTFWWETGPRICGYVLKLPHY